MICKITVGRGFRGLVNYLFHGSKNESQDRGELICSNMAGSNPRELAHEFASFRQLRKSLGKAVFHSSISLRPEDRALSNEEFSEIAQAYLTRMGFEHCPFLVIRHHDTEHSHIHIVASRIKPDGSVVSDSNSFQRAECIMRDLETLYGLKPVAPSATADRKSKSRKEIQLNQKGTPTMKKELTDLIDQAIADSHDITDFIANLERLGILLCPHIQNGRVKGLIYKWRQAKMKASDLGKKYQWENLIQAVPYTDRDMIALNKRKRAEEKSSFTVALPEDVPPAYVREYRRMLLGDDYRKMLADLYGQELVDAKPKGKNLEIQLKQGKIIDAGESISVEDMEARVAAENMVKLAKAKGWNSIVISGSDDFIRHAMQEAIKSDMPVSPTDDKQRMLLEEAKAALAIAKRQNAQQEIREDQTGFELPKLNPLKIGEWTSYQDKKKKKDAEEAERLKKKKRYGW